MRITFLILIVLAFMQLDAYSQEGIEVNFVDRNEAIKLTNEAIQNIKDKKAEVAINKLYEAIAIDSTYRQIYLQFYQVWRLNKTYSDTIITLINKGKKIFEEDDELHFYCGEIYRSKSEYKKAIIEFNKATEFAKKNGEDYYLVYYYYFNRGNCYIQMKQYENAIKDFTYALKLNSVSSSAFLNRGTCYYMIEKKEEACQDWKKADELGSNLSKKYLEKHCSK